MVEHVTYLPWHKVRKPYCSKYLLLWRLIVIRVWSSVTSCIVADCCPKTGDPGLSGQCSALTAQPAVSRSPQWGELGWARDGDGVGPSPAIPRRCCRPWAQPGKQSPGWDSVGSVNSQTQSRAQLARSQWQGRSKGSQSVDQEQSLDQQGNGRTWQFWNTAAVFCSWNQSWEPQLKSSPQGRGVDLVEVW